MVDYHWKWQYFQVSAPHPIHTMQTTFKLEPGYSFLTASVFCTLESLIKSTIGQEFCAQVARSTMQVHSSWLVWVFQVPMYKYVSNLYPSSCSGIVLQISHSIWLDAVTGVTGPLLLQSRPPTPLVQLLFHLPLTSQMIQVHLVWSETPTRSNRTNAIVQLPFHSTFT